MLIAILISASEHCYNIQYTLTYNSYNISYIEATSQVLHGCEMVKTRSPYFASIWLTGTVGYKVDSKLSLGLTNTIELRNRVKEWSERVEVYEWGKGVW